MADEPTPAQRLATVKDLQAAAEALAEARKLIREVQGRIGEDDDLRWLVGMLAMQVPGQIAVPPRLAPLVKDCVDRWLATGVSRYTVAVPVESLRPSL